MIMHISKPNKKTKPLFAERNRRRGGGPNRAVAGLQLGPVTGEMSPVARIDRPSGQRGGGGQWRRTDGKSPWAVAMGVLKQVVASGSVTRDGGTGVHRREETMVAEQGVDGGIAECHGRWEEAAGWQLGFWSVGLGLRAGEERRRRWPWGTGLAVGWRWRGGWWDAVGSDEERRGKEANGGHG